MGDAAIDQYREEVGDEWIGLLKRCWDGTGSSLDKRALSLYVTDRVMGTFSSIEDILREARAQENEELSRREVSRPKCLKKGCDLERGHGTHWRTKEDA